MQLSQSYNEWIDSVLTTGITSQSIAQFMDMIKQKHAELSASAGFLCRDTPRGGIFSPEKRNYEIPCQTGALVAYSAGLDTEAKYLRDIFNNKTVVIADETSNLSNVYLFAYEAPLMRVVTERNMRFRVSADFVGVNDHDEILVIETKLSGGDRLDRAILQCFGYAFMLCLHLAGAQRDDVIEHARDCMKKFHGRDEMAEKIQNIRKIKYMVIAPGVYFTENTNDPATAENTSVLLTALEKATSGNNGAPIEFGGFTIIENVHPGFKTLGSIEQFCLSQSSATFISPSLKFALDERLHQIVLKKQGFFSAEADSRKAGKLRGYDVDYCFPEGFENLNIFEPVRDAAYAYFRNKKIQWHKLGERHVLSSQAYCVNFLYPFSDKPEALRELLLPVYPDIKHMLPVEDDKFVAFEWNGGKNHLNEKITDNHSRGEYATYPDAAVKFMVEDGTIQIVLIEWKYTESYSSVNKAEGESGQTRQNTYDPFFQKPDCPINLNQIDNDVNRAKQALYYEPFYQLFRQQLLAAEMEKDVTSDARKVSILHICPKANLLFANRVTSPELANRFPGQNVIQIWKAILKDSDCFKSTDQGELFEIFSKKSITGFQNWQVYMHKRYRL